MSLSVIVMGSNPSGRLSEEDINDSLGSGIVYVSCTNGCGNTSRLVIYPGGSALDASKKYEPLGNAELKPSEILVVTFPEEGDMKRWLNARATKLVGKTVFVLSPSKEMS